MNFKRETVSLHTYTMHENDPMQWKVALFMNKTGNYAVSMPSLRCFSTNWEVNGGDFDHKCIQNIQQYSKVCNGTHKYAKVLTST